MPTSKTVITTMSQSGYGQYGKRMIETFDKHWPQSIKLKIYYEWLPYDYQKNLSDRIEWLDINTACPKLGEFKQRHKSNPHANGIKPGTDPNGKYSYLWDAVKFSHKSFCVSHATLNASTDIVIWLDADVVTHSPVSKEAIEGLLPEDHFVTYLGRQKIYPECGFVMYNCKSKFLKPFMETWKNFYQKLMKLNRTREEKLF